MVLVSHEHKFIFVKTAKTGSTSAEMFLEPLCAPPDHVVHRRCNTLITKHGIVGARDRGWGQAEPPFWRGHLALQDIRKKLPWWQYRRYRRVAPIRNPYTRAVSHFYYHSAHEKQAVPTELAGAREAFRAYVQAGRYRGDAPRIFVGEKPGLTDVLRFERLEADLKAFVAKLGLDWSGRSLGHERPNRSIDRSWPTAAFFDGPTAEKVRITDNWAFEIYGYSPDPEAYDVVPS